MKYITPFIDLLNEMSPYLLLGFLIAGVLKVFVPQHFYVQNFSKPNFRSVLLSALAGVPLPLCSCGVIPTAMSLRKEGASKGATVSFLISTPQTGVDSIIATYSLMGLPFAIIRPIVAFVTGLFGGTIANKVDGGTTVTDEMTHCDCGCETGKKQNKIVQVLQYGFVEMMEDIGKWLIVGIIGAGLIAIFIPDDFFTAYLHNPWLNMLIVLAISIPMYICATGSIPLAAVLMMKGLSPGAALLLLMAGPATNVATMTVIGKVLGKKTLFVYLLTISAGAIFSGLIIDNFLPASWFAIGNIDFQHHNSFWWINQLSSVILIVLLINAFVQKRIASNKLKKQIKMTKVYKIGGMMCNHCKANVEKNLVKVSGASSVQVDLEKAVAYVEGDVSDVEIEKMVGELGYEFQGKE